MGVIPADLTERVVKAEGHINAAERRLWNETERGLWSGHQAVARLAEAWLKLHGEIPELPALEKYLPRELMQDRIDAFAKAEKPPPLAACFADVLDAEGAILAEPFSQPSAEERADLEAGLVRQGRYIGGLRNLVRCVEDEIAARTVTLGRGDWARLPDGGLGCMIGRRGLTVQFLLPDVAITAPSQAARLYSLHYRQIETIERPAAAPIGTPAYYWLLDADRRWQQTHRISGSDWVTMSDLYDRLNAVLDAGAKAWWSSFESGTSGVSWSQIYAQQHVPLLIGKAPQAITTPLNEALRRSEALNREALLSYGRMPSDWRARTEDILALARDGLTALEDLLEQDVDLAAGEWVDLPRSGPVPIVRRDGKRLVLDLGRGGVRVASLFRTELRRVEPPVNPPAQDTEPDWHHLRWRWFACHPQASGGRDLYPCCGLPGVEDNGAAGCRLCGWVHDGEDFDPHRPSLTHAGLELALGRRRFAALGYAVGVADEPPGRQVAWLDPFVLARKRRLVAALDQLAAHDASEDEERLNGIDTLWTRYEQSLQGRREGED